jgi:hypothetical protein
MKERNMINATHITGLQNNLKKVVLILLLLVLSVIVLLCLYLGSAIKSDSDQIELVEPMGLTTGAQRNH